MKLFSPEKKCCSAGLKSGAGMSPASIIFCWVFSTPSTRNCDQHWFINCFS